MRVVKSKKYRTCKKCQCDIFSGEYYYPQRNKKAVCFFCGKKPVLETFLSKLLGWLSNHGK